MGAALFYGDSVITPSISVLSAVEGSVRRSRGRVVTDEAASYGGSG